MNSNQEALLSNSGKITDLFDDNKPIWEANKVISATNLKVHTNHKDIGKTWDLQKIPISGYANDKNKFRKLVNITTNVLFGIFKALAANTGDETIYEKYNKSITTIANIKDNEMEFVIKEAQKFATDNKDALKDYGLTDALMEKYGKEADGYITYLNKPAEAKAIRAAATQKLVILFKNLRTIYEKELDNEMMQYKFTEPVFYKQYVKARNIFDNPTHKNSLYGKVTDEETKKPIVDVTVTAKFKAGADIANSVRMTTEKGNYIFKKLEPGIYDIVFEKYNYDTLTIDIEIFKNKGYRRDVKLRKTE